MIFVSATMDLTTLVLGAQALRAEAVWTRLDCATLYPLAGLHSQGENGALEEQAEAVIESLGRKGIRCAREQQ